MLATGSWHLGTPSYWRDEAATLDAESRSIPALLHMLSNVDAVHGAYYLLMWPIVHTFGTSELALRLPSLLAMTVAAAGVAALGRRLHSSRAGLFAGLVFAVLPQVSRYAQEGRSYALVLTCAVAASYLLLRATTDSCATTGSHGAAADLRRPTEDLLRVTDGPRRRWLIGYGAAIALLGLLNLFGLLLLAGHAIFLLACHRALLRRWLVTAALGCLPALPIVVLAWRQRDQLGWLTEPDAAAPADLTLWLAGSTGSVVVVSVLIGLGLRACSSTATAWLALPWLLAPPVLLLSAAEVAMPVYVQRYVTYCLPALALLVGGGLAAITAAPRLIALLLTAGLGLPTQLAQREVGGHGDTIRVAADILAAHEHPGDGVIYACPSCHYPAMPREFAFAYPAAFARLDDLALAASPSASGTLRGAEADHINLDGITRVWLIETGGNSVPAPLIGMHHVVTYPAGNVIVALYERQPPRNDQRVDGRGDRGGHADGLPGRGRGRGRDALPVRAAAGLDGPAGPDRRLQLRFAGHRRPAPDPVPGRPRPSPSQGQHGGQPEQGDHSAGGRGVRYPELDLPAPRSREWPTVESRSTETFVGSGESAHADRHCGSPNRPQSERNPQRRHAESF
jgi:mannosyltransferase